MKKSGDAAGMTRRQFGVMAGGLFAGYVFQGLCRVIDAAPSAQGRLTARPGATPRESGTAGAGTHALGLASPRDAILQLPRNASPGPVPLLVLLHGAGGGAGGVLRRVGEAAGEAGLGVLAPDSRGSTWDGIRDGFGADVMFLDRALARVFGMIAIDPARLAVGGFSDGATYALSLGLINGDLFRRVLAFSPGFIIDGSRHGRPRVFISHGKSDPILPIDHSSRAIVPGLRKDGYDVTYREFDGRHEVPAAIAQEGMRWVARSRQREGETIKT